MKDYDLAGRWVPIEFINLKNINHLDRFVLACLYGLDDNGCTACDDYIGELVAATKEQVHRSIMKLHKLGYIQIECQRGRGVYGTSRKIYCKATIQTTVRNRPVVQTTPTNPSSGSTQNRPVVLEPVQSIPTSQSADLKRDTVEYTNNNIIYSTENEIKHEEKFQTLELKPKVGSDLLERLKEVVKEKHLMLGFGDEQLSTLSAFDEESLVICMRAASESCKGTRLSWNYYRKIVENNGQAKKVKKPTLASQFKFERKLFVI
mgnify:CR=1 FL=1